MRLRGFAVLEGCKGSVPAYGRKSRVPRRGIAVAQDDSIPVILKP